MSIFVFRSVFVYITLAALSERFSELSKFVALLYFRFGKGFFYKHRYSGTGCTAEVKVLFKVCLWAKILISIGNSTSKCSAQNLG